MRRSNFILCRPQRFAKLPLLRSQPIGTSFETESTVRRLSARRKEQTMKRVMLASVLALGLAVPTAFVGCDDTVSQDKKVEVKDDGTVKKEETKVTENADGSVTKTETKDVSKPASP
jgi:hypothetical protein